MNRLFSTLDVHPRDRLAYWQDVACKTFVEIDCRTDIGASFDATIWSGALSDVSIACVHTEQCDVVRNERHVSRASSDEVLLSLQLAGSSCLSQNGRQTRLQPGEFAIYDTLQPYDLIVGTGVRQLVLKMPRQKVERRLGSIAKYTAVTVRDRDPMGAFASGFLALILERSAALAQLDAAASQALGDQVLDLATLALRRVAGSEAARRSPSSGIALARLKMAIEQRLHDPTLTPGKAASAAGIGVRYANSLLRAEGHSLERYITERRLCRAADVLSDQLQRGRLIGEIAYAWGFNSASHFGRCFKDRFGMTPSDYREAFASKIL